MTARQWAKHLRAGLRRGVGWPLAGAWARLMALGLRPPAFTGAYPDYATARAHAPVGRPDSYDDDTVAAINFDAMCATQIWDYPVMFWLDRLAPPGSRVLDAGGHFGTKYIAFRDRLALDRLAWEVYDLPATIRAAQAAQTAGRVPGEIVFTDKLGATTPADLLLASGVLQYLDTPFEALVAALPAAPRHLLLNKVATRAGPTVVTLEKIGPARVPYQIRNRAGFEQSLDAMGYAIRDTWEIPSLARRIDTHPGLGSSTSRGYVLERRR